jgi:hypothetical protein
MQVSREIHLQIPDIVLLYTKSMVHPMLLKDSAHENAVTKMIRE